MVADHRAFVADRARLAKNLKPVSGTARLQGNQSSAGFPTGLTRRTIPGRWIFERRKPAASQRSDC